MASATSRVRASIDARTSASFSAKVSCAAGTRPSKCLSTNFRMRTAKLPNTFASVSVRALNSRQRKSESAVSGMADAR